MIAKFKIFILGFLLTLTSCHVPSRTTLSGSGGRSSYNEAIQKTNSEQMLLNLVRLRYYDIPYFLDVGGVTTQFTMKSSANAGVSIPGFDEDNPVNIGGDFTWQNQPTIQYSPLEGHAFAAQLLRPIDLRTIQQLIYSGWDVDRVFRLVIQNFNGLTNAAEASGPTPSYHPSHTKFYEATSLMRQLQKRGELQVGVRIDSPSEHVHTTSCNRETHTLQVAFPKGTELSEKLANLVDGAKTMKDSYVLQMNLGFTWNGNIGVMPRSILSCMYYLCESVEIPEEDLENGLVERTLNESGEAFDWHSLLSNIMSIQSNSSYPDDAYVCIKYRDHWFYIANDDLTSKKTFVLLLQLYNLQAGEASKVVPPILTIPLGV